MLPIGVHKGKLVYWGTQGQAGPIKTTPPLGPQHTVEPLNNCTQRMHHQKV